MNTNDLPPAAKLAALIEAGRAANPDLKQGHRFLLVGGQACALGFAALAAGATRNELNGRGSWGGSWLMETANIDLRCMVAAMNDNGASIEEICASLREGELAKVAA